MAEERTIAGGIWPLTLGSLAASLFLISVWCLSIRDELRTTNAELRAMRVLLQDVVERQAEPTGENHE